METMTSTFPFATMWCLDNIRENPLIEAFAESVQKGPFENLKTLYSFDFSLPVSPMLITSLFPTLCIHLSLTLP